jgi:hypothetical protein
MPNTNKKDGELDVSGMLWDVGVVMEDVVIVDELD